MPKSKLSALLSLLLVFSSGILVGAVAYRLYMVNTVTSTAMRPGPRPSPEEIRKHIVADMHQRIKLDDQQIAEINRIMDQTSVAFKQIRDKLNAEGKSIHDRQWEEIRTLMRPDQQSAFDQWRAQREAEREKRRQQGGGPPPPPR